MMVDWHQMHPQTVTLHIYVSKKIQLKIHYTFLSLSNNIQNYFSSSLIFNIQFLLKKIRLKNLLQLSWQFVQSIILQFPGNGGKADQSLPIYEKKTLSQKKKHKQMQTFYAQFKLYKINLHFYIKIPCVFLYILFTIKATFITTTI